jgi:Holliday junction resolvase
MRRAAKIDSNHTEIVAAFRKLGCSVLPLHAVGGGCPDVCVGKNKKSVLVEIKDPNKVKSKRELTADQIKFHGEWLGSLFVVETLGDVIDLVKGLER